jgi:hypothetical protein
MSKVAKIRFKLFLLVLASLCLGSHGVHAEETAQPNDEPPPGFTIFYGAEQRFGHLGQPQRWINVLGNVDRSDRLKSLSYRLNEGMLHPLSVGSDLHRLAESGDFNVELSWNKRETEPLEWAVESAEDSATDLSSGSLGLVPHNTDVTIHEVSVDSLDPPESWPKGIQVVGIPSTADGSLQKAVFEPSARPEARPLLVALHSWSGDYRQSSGVSYLEQCRERRWHFIHPDFRGVNRTPQSTCSDDAVTDISISQSLAVNLSEPRPSSPSRFKRGHP